MRAASERGHLMIASTVTSSSIGEIRAAGTSPLWFQLYASPDQGLMRHLLAAAEAARCLAVVLTVDSPTRGNREGERWFARNSTRKSPPRMGNFEGYKGPPRIGDPALTWASVDWLRANTRLPILLKGIVTREDAELAVRGRVDGLIVSNHGGRQEESGRGTLECLPEVVAAVGGRMPVLIDGGFRRGTDIFKALALGASAVCVGRPYLFGLGAYGEKGVARVLAILDSELQRSMQFAGTISIAAIKPAYLQRRPE
jgi:isopentenyl diphosphate isomerase/L-lactate dehydrogenase-like FMN-dependent dehydrogenase